MKSRSPSTASKQSLEKRFHALDSLRGIAAFTVLIEHTSLLISRDVMTNLPVMNPFDIFINGRSPTLLFFILSGFVLALPYVRNRPQPYLPFLVKRFIRIYIPFFFAIMMAALFFATSPPIADGLTTRQINTWWPAAHLRFEIIAHHLAMTGNISDMWLDSPVWSVIHEMRVSIIFPLLILLCRNWKEALFMMGFFACAAFLLTFANENDLDLSIAQSFAQSLILTTAYIPAFMLGILLAKHDDAIKKRIGRLKGRRLLWVFIFVIIILSLPPNLYLMPSERPVLIYEYASGILFSLAVAFLIASARHTESVKGILCVRPLLWLGKISYSLYLVHVPIMLYICRWLVGYVPIPVIAIMIYICSLAAGALFNRIIEQPAIRLGYSLADAIAASRKAANQRA